MKTSPLFAFALTAVVAILLGGGELWWILGRRGDLLEREARNRTALRENATRRKDMEELHTHQDAILEKIQKVTNAIVNEAPAPGSFESLRQTGIHVEPLGEHHGFEYGFSSEVEFHRFVPALAALESDYPLMRISELEIESNHDPFPKAATLLNVRGKFSLVKAQGLPPQLPLKVSDGSRFK